MTAAPTFKYEFNLTTVAAVIGIIGMLWNASARYTTLSTQFDVLANDVERHSGVAERRLSALEAQSRQFDNLLYRVQKQEDVGEELAKANLELSSVLSDAVSDIKIMREILVRMESQRIQPNREKN